MTTFVLKIIVIYYNFINQFWLLVISKGGVLMDGISVIIPTYNRKDELVRCLEKLNSLSFNKASVEIVVIDDCSTDGTSDAVKSGFPNVMLLRQEKKGPGAARNLGVKNAKHDIIAFTDSDCVVHDRWLDVIYETLSRDKSIGVLGGRTIEKGLGIVRYLHDPKGDIEAAREPYASTNNMAVRKDVFLAAGGFDPYFTFSCEDVDLCYRIRQKGYKIIGNADMAIDHEHPGNFFGWVRKSYRYEPGLVDFMEKYPQTKRFFPAYYFAFPLIAGVYAYRRAKALNNPLSALYLMPMYAAFIFAGIIGKVRHIVKSRKYGMIWHIPNLNVMKK